MKNICIGLIAHVDAGKTTLSEALLYCSGKIREPGRVDKRNTHLDTHELERERGISIFSKQAELGFSEKRITLLDTPGHVDFSGETERVLPVLDYAILVISGSDGVQAHTETLWNLLKRYSVPCFIFVTKSDLENSDLPWAFSELCDKLSPNCVDFCDSRELDERIAICDEEVLDAYSKGAGISDDDIARLICERKIFPTFFGSGLKMLGIDRFAEALLRYTQEKDFPEEFSAKIYKIAHDSHDVRLSYMRICGGSLHVRDVLKYKNCSGTEIEEKLTGIRIYNGDKFVSANEANAGDVCAVQGLSETHSGGVIGDISSSVYLLEPVMNYRIKLPDGCDPKHFLPRLRKLEEEEPLLRINYDERYGDIQASLMGQVQSEVLLRLIKDRCDADASLCDGRIIYKESVSSAGEGVGHFEPLRHYAEVHLLIEPAARGEGISFSSVADSDYLDTSWQKLVISYLEAKKHTGVLTGGPLTDMKITLVCGKAHIKHTQASDFREATYRALRHGLMRLREKGECVLLEPYYSYRLELPPECIGRAISDIIAMCGDYTDESTGDVAILTGKVPVSEFSGYASVVSSYSGGKGKLFCKTDGYYPCHNTDEVLSNCEYCAEHDTDNTADSVFCSHGSGFVVPWNEVENYMHLEAYAKSKNDTGDQAPRIIAGNLNIDDKELEAIMDREFGPIRRPQYGKSKITVEAETAAKQKARKELLIIDGYNLIFAAEPFSEIAQTDLEFARIKLCDALSEYSAFTEKEVILVFDAYRVKSASAASRKSQKDRLLIVYTEENELADAYIEKLIDKIGKDYRVSVVTSDSLIQLRAIGSGVLRISSREFSEQLENTSNEIRKIIESIREKNK